MDKNLRTGLFTVFAGIVRNSTELSAQNYRAPAITLLCQRQVWSEKAWLWRD